MTQELTHSKNFIIHLFYSFYIKVHRRRKSENDKNTEESKTFLNSIILLPLAYTFQMNEKWKWHKN